MPVTITVTQEDVNEGVSGCTTCPVALAINRHLIDGHYASVGTSSFAIRASGLVINRPCSKEVYNEPLFDTIRRWITAFDSNFPRASVPPPPFEAQIPNCLLKV